MALYKTIGITLATLLVLGVVSITQAHAAYENYKPYYSVGDVKLKVTVKFSDNCWNTLKIRANARDNNHILLNSQIFHNETPSSGPAKDITTILKFKSIKVLDDVKNPSHRLRVYVVIDDGFQTKSKYFDYEEGRTQYSMTFHMTTNSAACGA
ncbi:MAG TPA: hypothetical protein VF884_15915 [Nitrososphaeraceae archaeon]